MLIDRQPQRSPSEVSHNLLGQRLGRKGQETRERILTAALRLLEDPCEAPITLTSVARETSVAMTTLYLYFPDLGDLVLAALNRVMDSADAAFIDQLRTHWPDDRLHNSCLTFLQAHLRFWQQHARILHMRNSLADSGDARFLDYRNRISIPLIDLLVRQMDQPANEPDHPAYLFATVLLTGFERLATVLTNPVFQTTLLDRGMGNQSAYIDALVCAEAELVTLAVRSRRDVIAQAN